MATKVQLLSIDRKSVEHIRRSKAEAWVRQLVIVQLSKYVYQRVAIKQAQEIAPGSAQKPTDVPITFWDIDKRLGLKEQMPERKIYKPWEIAAHKSQESQKWV